MKNYSIICTCQGFNKDTNVITQKLNNLCNYVDKNDNNLNILFVGSFIRHNDDINIIKTKKCTKILFISEPIEIAPYYFHTLDLYKNNFFDYIIGCTDQFKYPLYMDIIIYFDKDTFNNINKRLKSIDIKDKRFCALINTHDTWNTRVLIYDKIKEFGQIDCPSKLLNNCTNEELNRLGNSNYLSKYLFNICSENTLTNIDGYITEKLVNCCNGGAIPIYCGWFDKIDDKIFNKNRILFFNPNDSKSIDELYLKIKYLMEHKKQLKKFYMMDVYMDSAYDTVQKLDLRLMKMFKRL